MVAVALMPPPVTAGRMFGTGYFIKGGAARSQTPVWVSAIQEHAKNIEGTRCALCTVKIGNREGNCLPPSKMNSLKCL